ncbi:glycosyltransferase family 2 protein [Clostridium magnum]|uniref:Putative glycosyltransferase EpsE n=1 Tax=Clostridium magnum DSM 2767 TaxID=1121326 RepID=A0A162RSW0_9CLOT|nr:glycosyltransferase [Clostridium magnum]KZL90331.1 putative glycosyltransferase EpsE [Clostridium magnum DSM 2767]SHH82266.1 Glycosyltransferases involved in cell wall biogenesis [Clostridium magnum DSM 2767]
MTQLCDRKPGLVSIVIATYNYGHFIIDALDGIEKQTYPNIELIIMDDASEDDTEELVNSWYKKCKYKFSNFIYLKLPRNIGAGWAYNIGFQISSGEYTVIHDADDVSYPEKIKKQVKVLEEHPDTAMVGTGFRTFKNNILESKAGSAWLSFNSAHIEKNYKKHLRHCVAYGTLMFRAAILEEIIGCFKAIPVGNDMFFVNNIVNHDFIIENIKEELHYVRKHTGSMSSQIRHKQDINVLKKRKVVDDLVSIVLPVKNSELTIYNALKSIGAQTYPNIEIIIIDDWSTDNSKEVIDNWYKKYRNHSNNNCIKDLLYFKPPREAGYPWIYNMGAYLSRGEYIAFHHDKGLSHPERIQKQVDFLKNNFMYSAVGTNCKPGGTMIRYDDKIEDSYITESLNCVNINTLMVRYEQIHKTAGFNNLMQGAWDFEFIYRLLNNGYKVQNLRDVLYFE